MQKRSLIKLCDRVAQYGSAVDKVQYISAVRGGVVTQEEDYTGSDTLAHLIHSSHWRTDSFRSMRNFCVFLIFRPTSFLLACVGPCSGPYLLVLLIESFLCVKSFGHVQFPILTVLGSG